MSASTQDAEHLRVLSILHYVWGGLVAALSSLSLIYTAAGFVMIAAGSGRNAPPAWAGALLVLFGFGAFLIGAAFGILTILSGRWLAARKHHTFCMVIAAISCLSVPFGTALGVFTLVVLSRPAVKQTFAGAPAIAA